MYVMPIYMGTGKLNKVRILSDLLNMLIDYCNFEHVIFGIQFAQWQIKHLVITKNFADTAEKFSLNRFLWVHFNCSRQIVMGCRSNK